MSTLSTTPAVAERQPPVHDGNGNGSPANRIAEATDRTIPTDTDTTFGVRQPPSRGKYLVLAVDDETEPFIPLFGTDDRQEAEEYRDQCNANPENYRAAIAVIEDE